jgi:hypothetical protein
VLLRLQDDVLVLEPKAIVLLIGTNDLEEGATPEMVAGNVKLMLSAMKRHSSQMPIVLCQVFPSSERMRRPAEKIRALNTLYLAAVKGDPQVVAVDTWSVFADAGGNARASEFPDLLHPNDAGYAKWAAALRPVFARLRLAASEGGARRHEGGRCLTGTGRRCSASLTAATSASGRHGFESTASNPSFAMRSRSPVNACAVSASTGAGARLACLSVRSVVVAPLDDSRTSRTMRSGE